MKKTILTVGLTHSGKTTFAELLDKSLVDSFVLDTDKIAVFIKNDFPKLFFHTKETSNYSASVNNPSIKLSILLKLLEWGINLGLKPIFSNGNQTKRLRKYLVDTLHLHGFEVGFVFLNLPIEIIDKRIKETTKTNDCFMESKNYEEVLGKQLSHIEFPTLDEADKFFEIKDESDFDVVLKEVKEWINKN